MRRCLLAVIATLAAVTAASCEGPEGPMGPPGPQGEPGPGYTVSYSGRLDLDGYGEWRLPDEAGSISDPPAISCYLGQSAAGPYLLVTTDTYSGVACGLVQDGAGLYAVMISSGAYAGWYYKFVAVYD